MWECNDCADAQLGIVQSVINMLLFYVLRASTGSSYMLLKSPRRKYDTNHWLWSNQWLRFRPESPHFCPQRSLCGENSSEHVHASSQTSALTSNIHLVKRHGLRFNFTFIRTTQGCSSALLNAPVVSVATIWPSLPDFDFREHHLSSQDKVITLAVVLCGPLYIRSWSLGAFGNRTSSHYCRLHKTQAANELASTFPLAWNIVLVIESKDVEDLSDLWRERRWFIRKN